MKVTARGFLYQGTNGEWILSPEAHLKSCCIKSPAKISEQILLEGNGLSPATRAVSVTGSIKVQDGRLYLTEAEIEPLSLTWIGWLVVLAACGLSLMVWMRRKQHLLHSSS